ncbi:MAG: carbohydrate ABC transporter permease [Candidatus Bipolaricaulia bacterium]
MYGKKIVTQGSVYAVVVFFVMVSALPFAYMAITAFKTNHDIFTIARDRPPFFVNESPTLDHFNLLFNETLFFTFIRNTFVIGALVVAITLLVAVPAAYSLARMVGHWGESLGIGIFLTYLVPPSLLFIPLARVVAELGLQNSLWALVIVYPTFTIPFCTWLLMGFFKSIPRDIEEQAMIDGYNRVQAIIKTVLPLSIPGLLMVVVFAFTLSTHEFIYALTFVQTNVEKPISTGIPTELVRGDVFRWGPLLAGAFLASLPPAILYSFFLDRFISGFTAGAVKG